MGGFVVYDLEWTAWKGSRERNWSQPGEHREIIQIGAVRVGPGGGETASFNAVVRPRINPVLSDYVIALTGVTQDRVDRDGVDYPAALCHLLAFAGTLPMLANGADKTVIDENCRLHGLPPPASLQWRNVSPLLASCLGRQGHVLSSDLSAIIGANETGRAHDALDDARAIATTLAHLMRRGQIGLAELTAP